VPDSRGKDQRVGSVCASYIAERKKLYAYTDIDRCNSFEANYSIIYTRLVSVEQSDAERSDMCLGLRLQCTLALLAHRYRTPRTEVRDGQTSQVNFYTTISECGALSRRTHNSKVNLTRFKSQPRSRQRSLFVLKM